MESGLLTAVLAAALFAATDVDDLFLLIAFFADPRARPGEVVAGQFLGIGVLVGASLALALMTLAVPTAYVGLLGFIPVAMGLARLRAFRAAAVHDDERAQAGPWRGALTVAAVTIANGGDNLGVYTPVFAVRPASEIAVIVAVFAVGTAVWCAAAHALVRHPALGPPIRRHALWLTPIVLVAVGVFVLYDADTVSLLRGG